MRTPSLPSLPTPSRPRGTVSVTSTRRGATVGYAKAAPKVPVKTLLAALITLLGVVASQSSRVRGVLEQVQQRVNSATGSEPEPAVPQATPVSAPASPGAL